MDAAKPTPEQVADWDRRLNEAKAMQSQGGARKEEARQVFETRSQGCFQKFRVNACRHEAKQAYLQGSREGSRIENEGKALERAVKKEQLADHDARHLALAPQREAELAARAAEAQAEHEQADSSRAKILAAKEAKARVGAERQAAEGERRRHKQEQHARKLAERMEKVRQRDEEHREFH